METSSPPDSTPPLKVETADQPQPTPQPSYVKLAMRNMVRKKGTSLKHFFLTTIALLGVMIGLSYLTR